MYWQWYMGHQLRHSYITMGNKRIMNNQLRWTWKWLWPTLRYYPSIFSRDWRKPQNLSHDSQPSKPGSLYNTTLWHLAVCWYLLNCIGFRVLIVRKNDVKKHQDTTPKLPCWLKAMKTSNMKASPSQYSMLWHSECLGVNK
jgi:hypothetical protein